MKGIENKHEAGFTLVEVLMALSIMSIIMITFSSIILNSAKLYKEEMEKRTEVQKSILLSRWIKNKIDESSSAYIAKTDGKLTIKEEDSNKLFKIVLYQSKDKPAVGIEKYEFQDSILRYIEKEPILNGVKKISIREIGSDINNQTLFNLNIRFADSQKSYQYILY